MRVHIVLRHWIGFPSSSERQIVGVYARRASATKVKNQGNKQDDGYVYEIRAYEVED